MRLVLILAIAWIPNLLTADLTFADDTAKEEAVANKEKQELSLSEAELARLKAIFQCSQLVMNDDGTITATYDFTTKEPGLTGAFSPPIEKTKQRIRWSRGYEGTFRTVEDGIVIADHGVWLHDAVWQDVRMNVDYLCMAGMKKGDVLAAVFLPTKGKRLYGANLGQQCVKLKPNVKLAAKPIPSQYPTAGAENRFQFGLEMKDEVLRATRNGRTTADTEDKKKFVKKAKTGQVGLAWRGMINGFVFKIEMTGRLDDAWLKKQLR